MVGTTSSVKGVLMDFLTPILPNIEEELTREGLIYVHQLVSCNVASVALNIRGGRYRNLALKMTAKEYRA